MEIPYERWFEAIQVRRSKRKFEDRKVESDAIERLEKLITEINGDINGLRIVLIQENTNNIFKGLVGSYGKIEDAPAFAAFVGNTDTPNIEEKIGYAGECLVLEATSLGLGTCWVAGTFNPSLVKRKIELSGSEKLFAITPVGYPREGKSLEEKIVGAIGNRRKPLKVLCTNYEPENFPEWVMTALESARIAPSAVNRQPWRFTVENNRISISLDKPEGNAHASKKLDCGIAMLHLEVGALSKGVKGCFEYLEDSGVAVYKVKE